MRKSVILGALAISAAGLGLVACSSRPPASTAIVIRSGTPVATKSKGKGHGPPPHAPAHGYRHKNKGGVEMVYDSELRVYVVSGRSRHYYCDGRYYRRERKGWQVSVTLDGPWKVTAQSRLPGRLSIHS